MYPVIRTLIDVITEIRTPLIFWGFMLMLILIGFYIFSKNNEWYKATILPIIKKLNKSNLFKITRLFLVFMFIIVVTLIILAFISPLIDKHIEKKYDLNFIEHLEDSSLRIIETISIDNNYREIIRLYESGKIEQSRLLTEKVFNYKAFNHDDYLGYTVAAYFGEGEYENAAKLVLERDKNRARWDYSLRNDLAQCIRSYTLKTGNISAIKLVEELQSKYGNKLSSVFWTVLPIEFLRATEKGYYSVEKYPRGLKYNEIKELIRIYQEEKFIDYAYFAIGDYQSILSMQPKSRILDLALYGAGYTYILDFRRKFGSNMLYEDRYFIYTLISEKDVNDNLDDINSAIYYFKKYVSLFDKLPQTDDSYYWLGWLYAQKREYDKAIDFLIKGRDKGNMDYKYAIDGFLALLLNDVPISYREIIFKLFAENNYYQLQESKQSFLINNFDPIEAIYKVLNEPSFFAENTIELIIEKQLGPYGNLSNCIKIYEEFNSIIDIGMIADVYGCAMIYEYDKTVNKIQMFRDFPNYRRLAYQILGAAERRFLKDEEKAYLKYLQIRIATIEYPLKLENLVKEFLNQHPDSDLCDDVLAELIRVLSVVLWFDKEKVDHYYNLLIADYSGLNAIDNAMYWYAIGYETSWDGDKAFAKDIYLEIIRKFPFTRFASYSLSRIYELNKNN